MIYLKIGYVRSNKIEEIEEQVKSLAKYGVDKMFVDRTKKLHFENSEFSKMLDFLKPGDEVIIDEFECLYGIGNLFHEILKKLKNENINMKSIGENFNNILEIEDYVENGIGKYLIDPDPF